MEEYGEIPIPRFGHTAVVYKNSLYIFGGWNGYETLEDLYQYSFISNFWYLEKVFHGVKPPPRYRHASTIIGDSMFIFGGINTRQNKFNDLYEYSFPKREWRLIETNGYQPSPRTFHSLVSSGNQILLIGGSSTDKLNDVNSITICYINSIFDDKSDHTAEDSLFNVTLYNDVISLSEDTSVEDPKGKTVKKMIKLLKKQVNELSNK